MLTALEFTVIVEGGVRIALLQNIPSKTGLVDLLPVVDYQRILTSYLFMMQKNT